MRFFKKKKTTDLSLKTRRGRYLEIIFKFRREAGGAAMSGAISVERRFRCGSMTGPRREEVASSLAAAAAAAAAGP